jgi:hypothetical protein
MQSFAICDPQESSSQQHAGLPGDRVGAHCAVHPEVCDQRFPGQDLEWRSGRYHAAGGEHSDCAGVLAVRDFPEVLLAEDEPAAFRFQGPEQGLEQR